MKESIAQRLGIKKFPFQIKDENGRTLYCEDINGYWYEYTYDERGKELTFKNSNGYSWEKTYDDKGNLLTYKDSNGYWEERTYDDKGNQLTFKNSNGNFEDYYRPKQVELSLDEIANKFGIDVKQLKIKK